MGASIAPAGITEHLLVRGVAQARRITFRTAAALHPLIGMRRVPFPDDAFCSLLNFGVELGRTIGSRRKPLARLMQGISGTIERSQLLQHPSSGRFGRAR